MKPIKIAYNLKDLRYDRHFLILYFQSVIYSSVSKSKPYEEI